MAIQKPLNQKSSTSKSPPTKPPDPIEFAAPGTVNCHSYTASGYQRLIQGVYARTPDISDLDFYYKRFLEFLWLCQAVLMKYRHKGAVLYGPTAMQVMQVPLPKELEDWDTCHILLPDKSLRPRRKGVVAHYCLRPIEVWHVIAGLPVPHPVEAWLQLTGATLNQMVEVGDGFLRRQHPLLTREDMEAKLLSCAGLPGVRLARKAYDLVREGTDSLPETSTRLALVDAGLPTPLVNPPVKCTPLGAEYFVDMAYLKPKVGVEYDGGHHFETQIQIQEDVLRRRLLQEEGWMIIQVTAPDLRHPEGFVRSVETALVLRGGV